MVHHQYFSDEFKLNGTERSPGEWVTPDVTSGQHRKAQKAAASGCIRQGNAREDGEAVMFQEQNLCVPVGKGSCLGNVLKNKELKLRGQGKQAHVIVGS